jgi:hypothetical protein
MNLRSVWGETRFSMPASLAALTIAVHGWRRCEAMLPRSGFVQLVLCALVVPRGFAPGSDGPR